MFNLGESTRYHCGLSNRQRHNSWQDPTAFDHIDITNIRLTLNADSWPKERMTLNFEKNEYAETDQAYSDFQSGNGGQKQPLLDYAAFKTHCLFVNHCENECWDLNFHLVMCHMNNLNVTRLAE